MKKTTSRRMLIVFTSAFMSVVSLYILRSFQDGIAVSSSSSVHSESKLRSRTSKQESKPIEKRTNRTSSSTCSLLVSAENGTTSSGNTTNSQDDDETGGTGSGTTLIPVILLSLGRSGSSVTWDTMSALTGSRNTAYEITGGTFPKSIRFFDSLQQNPLMGYDWIIRRLCEIKQYRRDISEQQQGIFGFQWKPYMASFNHEYAKEGLRYVSSAYHGNPPIRFVYLTRNPIDRKISNLRHSSSKERNTTISAHCSVGDDECIREHSKFENGIELPTGLELMNWLRVGSAAEHKIQARLLELNVSFIHVTYERLYHSGSDAEEWMRIFRFLGMGPTENLTMMDVRDSFRMAPTHKRRRRRNETIANFADVEKTLRGTEYEHLLYDDEER